jgi:hypothetical protein
MNFARTATAFGMAGYLAMALADGAALAGSPNWTEAKWPFLIDQWGLGQAYHCKAADCGVDVTLYLRAKVGFCNCTTGVAEDDEVDRVGDISLIGWQSRPRGAGMPVSVAWMKGRGRSFVVDGRDRKERHARTIAVSNKCDAVVATVVAERAISSDIEQAAMEFLGSAQVLRWVEANTGL